MKVDLYEVFSNFVPQMEDNSPLTPDRSLNGGSVKHNEVENNVDWSLDNNQKTPLSDRTDRFLYGGFLMGTIMPFHPGRASRKGKKKQRKLKRRQRKNNWEKKVDLNEVFSNFVPQMEDNSPLTPDRSLIGSSVKHNEVENNVNWSLDNNEKTPLSDRTDRLLYGGFLMGTIMPFHPGRASPKGKKKQRKLRRRQRKKSEGPIPMDWEPL